MGLGVLVAGCALAACSSSPTKPDALEAKGSATTTTTSMPVTNGSTPVTGHGFFLPTHAATTVASGIAVPNVIGLTARQARPALRNLGFAVAQFNSPCHKGTPGSQSIVTSMSVPGTGSDPRVGATPLSPGTHRPARSEVAITFSGCYPHGAIVPDVTGLTFDKAVHRLHVAGLSWACFSAPVHHAVHSTTTSSTVAEAPTDKSSTTTTTVAEQSKSTQGHKSGAKSDDAKGASSSSTTTTTTPHTPVVLSQGTKAGTVLAAHTAVNILMHHCPQ